MTGIHPNAEDTILLLQQLSPDADRFPLQLVTHLLGVNRKEKHRALPNPEDTVEVLQLLSNMKDPPHFNVEEQAMYTAALKELENHRLRMLQRAKYFEGKEPENERTAGNILLGSEGVRIISNKEHKSLLVSYDYGALLWCTLTTDSSRQGPRQAIRHNR